MDGYYIKCGWKKYLEASGELSKREWRHLRNKVIGCNRGKGTLDLEITGREPDYIQFLCYQG